MLTILPEGRGSGGGDDDPAALAAALRCCGARGRCGTAFGAGAELAVRAAAAAARRARRQVPALRGQDPRQRPAGDRGLAPRAAGGEPAAARPRRRGAGSRRQAWRRARCAASLLDQGTTTRSAEQIANAIDSIGGALGTGAGTELSFVNAIVMKDSLNFGLDLVSDIAQHPAFAAGGNRAPAPADVCRGCSVSYDDPEFLANVVFDRLVYGLHPYGRPQTARLRRLPRSRATISWRSTRKWFGANNAILAIVGDVSAGRGVRRRRARVRRAGRKADQPRPASRRPAAAGAARRRHRQARVRCRPRSASATSAFRARATTSWRWTSPSRCSAGKAANRLHRVLRSERGLTYGASADFNALKQAGDIVAETNTRSETTGETLRLMVDEIGGCCATASASAS